MLPAMYPNCLSLLALLREWVCVFVCEREKEAELPANSTEWVALEQSTLGTPFPHCSWLYRICRPQATALWFQSKHPAFPLKSWKIPSSPGPRTLHMETLIRWCIFSLSFLGKMEAWWCFFTYRCRRSSVFCGLRSSTWTYLYHKSVK